MLMSLTNARFFHMARKLEIRTEIEQYSVHGPLQEFVFKTWRNTTLREIYKAYNKLREYPLYTQVFQTF